MNKARFPRRRFLQMSAALSLAGMGGVARAGVPVARWRGVALGAQSQIILSGVSDAEAAPIFAYLRDEIARLEGIFSLYQGHSSLSRLNTTGALHNLEPELQEVLSLSQTVWDASFGAFDPSVQPLWLALSRGQEFAGHQSGFGDMRLSAGQAVLKPGMALTLNGVAQGFVTDRITMLLREQGFDNLVVDAGEVRALGQRNGSGWQVGVADPTGRLLVQMSLRERALATSSPSGATLAGGQGHIIDGRTGQPATRWKTVSISHESAVVADALSTAACCLSAAETTEMLRQFPDAALVYRN